MKKKVKSESKTEAARRGGLARTPAKLAAAALARKAKLEANEERRRSLRVPAPFENASDFLSNLRATMREGAGGEIARAVNVSTSTVSKWLRGAIVPSQQNLNKVADWWRTNRDHTPDPREAGSGVARKAEGPRLGLARLPDDISARLARAARLRNVKPMDYAAQILDRHLPDIEEMA